MLGNLSPSVIAEILAKEMATRGDLVPSGDEDRVARALVSHLEAVVRGDTKTKAEVIIVRDSQLQAFNEHWGYLKRNSEVLSVVGRAELFICRFVAEHGFNVTARDTITAYREERDGDAGVFRTAWQSLKDHLVSDEPVLSWAERIELDYRDNYAMAADLFETSQQD